LNNLNKPEYVLGREYILIFESFKIVNVVNVVNVVVVILVNNRRNAG
tara:strand:+ start:130 stop:270 length:141 start_codon:yes stop_codon:yes gene_type:complete